MPLYCPDHKQYPDKKCADCHYLQDDRCVYLVPSIHLLDILTKDEIQKRLEEQVISAPIQEREFVASQWDTIRQLKAEIVGWRQKHADVLLAIDKMRKPKRQSKYS